MHSSLVHAGQLYRFVDQNGVITISKTLPPNAAQNGYDILNDKSLRLIEHVAPALTEEQIAEQERQQLEQQEMQRLAEIAKKQQQEKQRQQAIEDQNLLASYQSEQDLIKARDSDLSYRQTQLEQTMSYLNDNNDKLHQLQQKAAEQELSGRPIDINLKKQLAATQQEIANNQQKINRLHSEIEQLTEQYEHELVRLNYLLSEKLINQ